MEKLTKYFISDQHHNELKIMLSEVHNLFMLHNIPYIIDFGTLLGACRHKDIMRWDDDADVSILDVKYWYQILDLCEEIEDLGYTLYSDEKQKLHKIITKDPNNYLCNGRPISRTCLDIFTKHFNPITERYEHVSEHFFERFKNSYHTKEELLPFKQYEIGKNKYWGPNNGVALLDRQYPNWLYEIVIDLDHNIDRKKAETILIEDIIGKKPIRAIQGYPD